MMPPTYQAGGKKAAMSKTVAPLPPLSRTDQIEPGGGKNRAPNLKSTPLRASCAAKHPDRKFFPAWENS